MIWLFIGLQFALLAVSILRWTRVAQQANFAIGSLSTCKRERADRGSADRIHYFAVVGISVIGMVIWPLSVVGAALWLAWPRSVLLRDHAKPVVWDRSAKRFAFTTFSTLFLLLAALVLATIYSGLYAISLLSLLVIVAGEWTLRMSQPRTVSA